MYADIMTFVETTDLNDVVEVLDKAEISNGKYCREQFEKYFSQQHVNWMCAFKGENPAAMIAWQKKSYRHCKDYVCEIQAFQSGHKHGEVLLRHFISFHPKSWLIADWTQGKDLLDYYRMNFSDLLEETMYSKDQHGNGIHAFVTKSKYCHEKSII